MFKVVQKISCLSPGIRGRVPSANKFTVSETYQFSYTLTHILCDLEVEESQ